MRLKALSAFLLLPFLGNAQTCDESDLLPSAIHRCAEARRAAFSGLAKTTVASLAEEDYDMKYVKLDVAINNTSTFIRGSVITNAVVRSSTMPAYIFELAGNMTVDSVKINGVSRTWTSNGVVRTVSLPTALTQGALFSAQVWYRGTATDGLFNDASPSWGTDVTWSLSQPYAANGWWPCKQSLQDKIDSCDIWVTVPSTLKAGANGVLQNVTPNLAGFSRYEWKHRYPIDHYLISIAAAPYTDYTFYVKYPPASNDSMRVQNYVYGDNTAVLPFWKTRIDSTGGMIQHLSKLFGRYPFWKEKYGHCMAPIGGGMEHQTMTTQGNFSTELTVHELGHQWWGDNITCASWSDIWLNEGFASYCEYLYRREFQGAASAAAKMRAVHNSVMRDGGFIPVPTGSVYVTDTVNQSRLFSSRLTYDKGSAVLHTLRFEVGDDSAFFSMLRAYRQQYEGGTATTEDFKNSCETFLGRQLDTFFNQWVYGEGYPTFSATWNQVGNDVVMRIAQSNVNTSTGATVPVYFATPLEVRLTSAAGDTVVRVYLPGPATQIELPWSKAMTGLRFDPNNWVMNDTGAVSKDLTLVPTDVDEASVVAQAFSAHPNPARDAWQVGGLQAGSTMLLTDLAGRVVWRGTSASNAVNVPASALIPGMYLLRVDAPGAASQSLRLVKR